MTVSMGMILFGAMLIYGGWTNRSIGALAHGDNGTQKSSQPNTYSPGTSPTTTAGGTTSSGAKNPPRPSSPAGTTPAGGPR